jgi:translation initiation factor 4E
MAVAGERLDDGDEVCGLVMSRRPKGDRIALWVKSANKDNQLLEIGRRMLEELNLMTANIELNFQPHSQAIRTGSSYSSGKSRLSLEAVRSLKLKN